MPNNRKSRRSGMQPGSLIYVGDEQAQHTKISMVGYDETNINATAITTAQEAIKEKDKSSILWLDITGLKDVDIISQVTNAYGLHPLITEDLLNTEQLPKLDIFENHIFVIIRVYFYDSKNNKLKYDQISLILGKNFVITIQERESTVFDAVKERLKNPQNLIRKKGADYLFHALLDVGIDTYYQVLESMGDVIEEIEEKIIVNARPDTMKRIHTLKRSIIFLRKSVWPLREIINGLHHKASPLIQDGTQPYLKDIYDHTIQVIDTVETYRDLLSGMMEIYISSINTKLNEVMKVLTVFATIFIPLTFISSLYGMNFDTTVSPFNMPELNWRYGYVGVLGVMLGVVIAMLMFFRRRKWI